MKFLANKQALIGALQIISTVVPANPVIPILREIKFDLSDNQLKLTASDQQNILITSVEVEGSEDGSVCFDGKLMLNIIKTLPEDEIEIEQVETIIILHTKGGKYEFPAIDSKDFPLLPEMDGGSITELSSETLKDGLSKTIYAVGVDNGNAIDNLLLRFENNEFILASTTRVTITEFVAPHESNENCSLLINKKSSALLKSMLTIGDVLMKWNKRFALFEFNGISLYVVLAEGIFPDYKMIIRKSSDNLFKSDKASLVTAIKRLLMVTTSLNNEVRINYSSANQITVTTLDEAYKRSASENLFGEYTGEDMTVAYNGKQLLEILSAITGEAVNIEFNSAVLPNILKSAEPDGYVTVTSPINILK